MKKALTFFAAMLMFAPNFGAHAAVAVKKAAPVAAQTQEKAAGVTTLIPTVMNIVQGVQTLNAKQKELTDACVPSSAEVTFVDNTMKEWAKTGAMSAKDVERALNRRPCPGGTGYANYIKLAAGTDMDDICFDTFAASSESMMIWAGYPKVGKTTYCADGSVSCSAKMQKTASDIYEIFNLIDFSQADYTKSEATMAAKLISKIEDCSNAKLSAKKKAMWGDFLVTTIGNVGQSTNTGAIMETVRGISASGGGAQSLQSIGAIATQFLNK